MPNMKHTTLNLIAVVAILAITRPGEIQAATSTWTGSANTYFTNAANWTPGFPAVGDNIVLGATATVDLTGWNNTTRGAGWYGLGALTFNSTAGVELTDPQIDPGLLRLGGDIAQSGSGDITNTAVAFDLGTVNRSFKGAGTGKVLFNGGSMASTAGISVDGAYYAFRSVSGSFTSMSVNSGGTAEIGTTGFGNLTLPASGSPSSMGTDQALTINGGAAVLDTEDALGAIDDFSDRIVAFGANGGALIWNKSVTGAGGPVAFIFNNGVNPAKLINGIPMVGYFDNEQSAQLTCFSTGSGDVHMIVTNGGLATMVGNPGDLGLPYYYAPTYPKTNSFTRNDFKLTIFGQPGGDPTLGDSSTSVGRFMTGRWGNSWDSSNHTNRGNIQLIAGGIFCRDILLFLQRNSNPRFLGSDITIENGTTLFSGGGTGGTRTLNIGTGDHPGLTNTTLRIKDGATAVLDQQVYSGQGSAGVRLNAKTMIEAGGSLQIKRTFTGFAGRPIVVTGSIAGQGNGTSGKESVLVVDLPLAREDQFGRVDSSYTDPVTLFPGGSQGGGTLIDDPSQYQNSTGVKFYEGYANLVVNGSGLLGLRVQGYADFLTNVLTGPRFSAISGSGGTLTVAITNDATIDIPNGPGSSSAVFLGLDNVGSNIPTYTLGTDASMANFAGLVLKGGTARVDDSAAVTMQTLALAGVDAAIQLGGDGATASVLNFANSSGTTWAAGTLNIVGWGGSATGGGSDQIKFGTDATGLTAGQLAKIQWINPFGAGNIVGATILSTGEIVPPLTQILSPALVGGNLVFSVQPAQAGQTSVIQCATNLTPPVTWVNVLTNTGTFNFTNSANLPESYYRVLVP